MYFYSGHHGAGQLVNRHSRTDALFRLPALRSRRRGRLRGRRRHRRAVRVASLWYPPSEAHLRRKAETTSGACPPLALPPKRASTVNTIF